jgi:hypothetical protein
LIFAKVLVSIGERAHVETVLPLPCRTARSRHRAAGDEDDVGALTSDGLDGGAGQRFGHLAARAHEQLVPGGQQVAGHRGAHDAQADETEIQSLAH